MKKGTFRFIIVLVALLFVNIEAAQAGLVHRIKIFIRAEFPDHQLIYMLVFTGLLVFIAYVIMAPVPIGGEKWSKLDYYSKSRNATPTKSEESL